MTLERRHLGGDVYALVSTTLERSGFLAAFTERTGGVSPPPFDTLNCSLVTDDDPSNGRKNRDRVIAGLGIPPFASGYQVHGTTIARVGPERRGAGFDTPNTRIRGVDGLATKSPRIPIAVLVADCLPIVVAAPAEGTVAVIHAGWRGLAGGILRRAVQGFDDPGEVRAVIGPAVGPDHYRVGKDVAEAVGSGCDAGAVTALREGSLHLDLPGTARSALRGLGVRRIEVAGVCTACEPTRFYSHRREGTTGRQLGLAMRL
jgi:YfiH family protein